MRRWATLLALLLPLTAHAGAWPRETGQVFVSFSHSAKVDRAALGSPGLDPAGYTSLYLEYGVTPRLTFGLDAGYAEAGDYKAIVFARRPVGRGSGRDLFAVVAGVGVSRLADRPDGVLQLGGAWGRGIKTPLGPGWVGADATLIYRVGQDEIIAKVDVTFGIRPSDRTKLMLQLFSGKYPGSEPYLRLAPGIVRRVGPRQQVEFGAEIGLAGDNQVGLKIGTWLEF